MAAYLYFTSCTYDTGLPTVDHGCITSLRRSVHLLYQQRARIQKYCRVRPMLFAGAKPANLHQQHTHTVLSLQSTGRCAVARHASHIAQIRALSFETPQLLPLHAHLSTAAAPPPPHVAWHRLIAAAAAFT